MCTITTTESIRPDHPMPRQPLHLRQRTSKADRHYICQTPDTRPLTQSFSRFNVVDAGSRHHAEGQFEQRSACFFAVVVLSSVNNESIQTRCESGGKSVRRLYNSSSAGTTRHDQWQNQSIAIQRWPLRQTAGCRDRLKRSIDQSSV